MMDSPVRALPLSPEYPNGRAEGRFRWGGKDGAGLRCRFAVRHRTASLLPDRARRTAVNNLGCGQEIAGLLSQFVLGIVVAELSSSPSSFGGTPLASSPPHVEVPAPQTHTDDSPLSPAPLPEPALPVLSTKSCLEGRTRRLLLSPLRPAPVPTLPLPTLWTKILHPHLRRRLLAAPKDALPEDRPALHRGPGAPADGSVA
jgi:hypothetical protein